MGIRAGSSRFDAVLVHLIGRFLSSFDRHGRAFRAARSVRQADQTDVDTRTMH